MNTLLFFDDFDRLNAELMKGNSFCASCDAKEVTVLWLAEFDRVSRDSASDGASTSRSKAFLSRQMSALKTPGCDGTKLWTCRTTIATLCLAVLPPAVLAKVILEAGRACLG